MAHRARWMVAETGQKQARSGSADALAAPSLRDDGRMGAVERVQPRVSFADLERAPETDAGTSSTTAR